MIEEWNKKVRTSQVDAFCFYLREIKGGISLLLETKRKYPEVLTPEAEQLIDEIHDKISQLNNKRYI